MSPWIYIAGTILGGVIAGLVGWGLLKYQQRQEGQRHIRSLKLEFERILKAIDEPVAKDGSDAEKQKRFYMGRIEKMYLNGNVFQAVDADLYEMIIDIYHELKDIKNKYEISVSHNAKLKGKVNPILARLAEIDPL